MLGKLILFLVTYGFVFGAGMLIAWNEVEQPEKVKELYDKLVAKFKKEN